MISSISTSALFSALQANMATSQTQVAQDAAEVSSQKVAQDLDGYGAQASTLTAVNSLNSRVSSYIANANALSGKLDVQSQALTQLASAAQGARSAVAEAVGQNDGSDLMATLQTELSSAAGALNTQYDGQYLFSGGQSNTVPVTATSLTQLGSASPLSSVFQNGQTVQASRLDDNTVVQTGVLASTAGTPLMSALQAIQAYNAGPNGPLSGPLTSAQASFLTSTLSQLDSAISAANTTAAQTGVVQQQVTTATTNLTDQQTALQGVVSNMTTPDESQVATQLSLAQTTLQASAQIFSSLQNDSLLTALGSSAGAA
jgi:flagellar hook-associated protein 3 FlgL